MPNAKNIFEGLLKDSVERKVTQRCTYSLGSHETHPSTGGGMRLSQGKMVQLWGSKYRIIVFFSLKRLPTWKCEHVVSSLIVQIPRRALEFRTMVPRSLMMVGPRGHPTVWLSAVADYLNFTICTGMQLLKPPTSCGSGKVTRKEVPRSGNTKVTL